MHHLASVDMKHFFMQHQNAFVDARLCFVQHQTFVSKQNYFLCNIKFLFWTLLRMLCHGDIFLLSHSNKNIITCQKINKISFACDTLKLIQFLCIKNFLYSVFTLHIGSMLIFLIVVLETKKILIDLLFTCLIYRSSY